MSDDDPDVDARDGPGEDIPKDSFLEPEDVADNFRDYIEALEAEKEMAEATIEGLEDGTIDVPTMDVDMPTPTPMEAWQTDRWRDLPDDYDHLPAFDEGETDG